MKYILLLLVASLGACSSDTYVRAQDYEWAKQACQPHGGISFVRSEQFNRYYVDVLGACSDGTRFTARRKCQQ